VPRKTFEIDGQRYIVIPYTGFRDLGVDAEPQVPLEVVPLYACVEDSLAEPLRQVKNREETLRDHRADILSAVVMGAKSKIREGSEIREGISYEGKLGFPFMLFRGERREEYSIQPTLLRLLNQVIPQHYRYTMRKDVRIERALAWKIRLALLVSDRVWLTKMRARAAARHYGAPSMLLDFTFDPRVAAYFAHPPIRDSERADFEAGTIPVGLIYGLRYDTLQRFFPIQSLFLERGSGHAFTFHFSTTTIRAPYLTFNENKKRSRWQRA